MGLVKFSVGEGSITVDVGTHTSTLKLQTGSRY